MLTIHSNPTSLGSVDDATAGLRMKLRDVNLSGASTASGEGRDGGDGETSSTSSVITDWDSMVIKSITSQATFLQRGHPWEARMGGNL
jgi:hypothetical protein